MESNKKNIALIGFMGSGKSSTGKMLAEKTEMEYLETDALIEERAGKPISKIFAEDGEPKFREIESEIIQKVSEKENTIISCGGGVVLNQENVNNLRKNSIIILFTATPEVILERTSKTDERPLLKTEDPLKKIKELLDYRQSFYDRAADITIDNSNIGIEKCADMIIEKLELKKIIDYHQSVLFMTYFTKI